MIKSAIYSHRFYGTVKQEPVTNEPKYNSRMMILVDVKSIIFRNLIVMLLYRKEGPNGVVTAAQVSLMEQGIGVPALLPGASILQTVDRANINFDIQCTMEIRVGALEKEA